MSSPVTYSRFGTIRTGMNIIQFAGQSPLRLQSSNTLSSGEMRINSGDDAVKVTLSAEAKAKAAATAKEIDAQGQKKPGIISSMLGQLSDITNRIKGFTQALSSGQLGEEQKKALNSEISNLTTEFQTITGSKAFTGLIDMAKAAQNSLQNGNAADVYAAMGSQASSLGTEFMSLVQHGSTFQLGLLQGSLSQIASADFSSVTTDTSVLDNISGAIQSAASAIQGPGLEKQDENKQAVPMIQKQQTIPQQQEVIYAGAGETALALKTFSATDMISAAMSGIDIGPVSQLTLVRNPTDEENKGKISSSPINPQLP